jgi:thioredoxin-dependent peroxiredoxin
VLGASFDTTADNAAFRNAEGFAYPLLSDADRAVGTAYETVRDPSHQYANFPERFSYLIDPTGSIVKAYNVTDPAGHADVVLADIEDLQD